MAEPIVTKDEADDAYDKIDRYLRNNLDDSDYAEFSEALEKVYAYGVPRLDGAQPPEGSNA